MDEVETAAADTTSDHSSLYHHHDHHPSSSSQSDLLLPSLPPFSKPLPQTQSHCMYNEVTEEPYSKRPRTSEPFEFAPLTSDNQNRLFGISEEPPTSSHHDPGPTTTAIPRSQKPVGIAQPFRMQESQSDLRRTSHQDEDLKQKSSWTADFNPSGDPTASTLTIPSKLAVMPSPEDELQYDSDKSQGKRFSKFTNESKLESNEKVLLGPMESETESESLSNFEYPFAPPSSESVEGESNNESESRMMERDRTNSDVGRSADQLGREWQPASSLVGNSLERRSSAPSLEFHQVDTDLPHGKAHHVFISHSTSDEKWAMESIVHPLTRTQGMKAVACCNFMHKSQYNDSEIKKAMKESCVVVLGISPAYLNSQRCKQEWRLAWQLSQGKRYQVVVAAVGRCSRPEELKHFLYLDFIDRSKLSTVWGMLLKVINDTVCSMKPRFHPEGHHAVYDSITGSHHHHHEKAQSKTDEDSLRMKQHRDSLSDLGNTSQEDHDMYRQTMTAGFEQLVQQMCQGDDTTELGGAFPGPWDATGDVSSLSDRSLDISDPRGSTAQRPDQTDDVESLQDAAKEKRPADVEEGEVSDSSGEAQGTVEGDQETVQSNLVATFYNKLAEPDADKRNESPIFYMRNFNNWVKSILIRSYLSQLPPGSTVLDLCCGKGGDLLKWKEGGIDYLVCADISEASVEACESRFRSPKMTNKHTGMLPFEAEFIVADCCEVRLRDRYRNPARRFNLASCQFSVHYSFESYEKAHMMLRNACENLRHGGYFIGTTVDSNQLVHRLRQAGQREDGSWSIGNDIFSVTLDSSMDPYNLPLFGARYNFKLHGVVDLPEFLVHFPLLVSMLKEFGMELKLQQNFYDFFSERRYNTDDTFLLHRMKAFNLQTGTMSTAEWEAVGLYLVYVFQKK